MADPGGADSQAHNDSGDDGEAARKRRLDRALDEALRETFPGSDPVSLIQPPPSKQDRHLKRRD